MVSIEEISAAHRQAFLKASNQSNKLHSAWVNPPLDNAGFDRHLEKYSDDKNYSFIAIDGDANLIGCINLNEIVRGALQSAYMGYYVFSPYEGKGLMSQAMRLVIIEAFSVLKLHRLEANIQPDNERSLNLVRSIGFRHEGYAENYLQINGSWQDHERFAITAEEFAPA